MSTYGITGLSTGGNLVDFDKDFEDLLREYVFDKWSLTGNLTKGPTFTNSTTIRFRTGFPDYNVPFEVLFLQYETTIIEKLDNARTHFQTTCEIALIESHRLKRDQVDPELGLMERHILKIIENYRTYQIGGIHEMQYLGRARAYEPEAGTKAYGTTTSQAAIGNYKKHRWISIARVGMNWVGIDGAPF